jgi:16S rRNA (adenine1518-N6/adenine1519-N6)-dimethyltransferase
LATPRNSVLATPAETIAVLARHGLSTKKSLGQHFLIDDNVIGRILSLAAPGPSDTILEVGPGIGTLTVALCRHAGAVVAVEKDSGLLPVLAETTAACDRFSVVHADAITVDPAQIARPFGPPVAMVANLPYGVAATVVLRFLELIPELRSVTVMVQAEVADRMCASPGCKEYGAYTVKLGLLARTDGRFNVARTCFLPPPRVDSAVLRLVRHPVSADPVLLATAVRVADAAFAQRRKTLRNSLKAALGIDADVLDRVLATADIDGSVRAETLAVADFVSLAEALLEHEL